MTTMTKSTKDAGTITRYAITHIDSDGCRVLTFSAAAKDTHATKVAAEKYLKAVIANNATDRLRSLYGPHVPETLKVRAIACYPSGDPAPGGEPLCHFMAAVLHDGFGIFNLTKGELEPRRRFKTKAAAVAACVRLNR